jgi:taurine transport system permease protein
MVLNAAEFLASDVVVMGIIVIGLLAFAFELLMRHLEKVLVPQGLSHRRSHEGDRQ